jgi:hypothetical protein
VPPRDRSRKSVTPKRDVQVYVHENIRMRLRDFDWVLRYAATMRTTSRERVAAGVLPPEFGGNPTVSPAFFRAPTSST